MHELLGKETGMLSDILRDSDKYNAMEIKKELEYAFELALEEWLFAGQPSPSVLTSIKARIDESMNESIYDVNIPDKYTAVGARAFIRRENLRSVMMPNTAASIAGFAFGWCDNLENVTVADREDTADISIGSFAFWGCENLRKVTMRGVSIKNIGDCVFYGSRKLRVDIYGDVNGDAESLLDRAFYGSRDLEVNIYTGGKRKEKRYDRIFNNRVQFF